MMVLRGPIITMKRKSTHSTTRQFLLWNIPVIQNMPVSDQMSDSDKRRPSLPENDKMTAKNQMSASNQKRPSFPENDSNIPDDGQIPVNKYWRGKWPS